MRCPKPFIMVSLVCLLLAACNTPPDVEQSEDVVAFVNVNVIPMDRERVVTDQTVIVRSGRIQEIGPTLQIEVPDRAVVIEGRGKYLMPGLADMHVHIYFFSEDALDLFIANGVTTIRNMWGRPDHLEWRARIEDGDLLGPTIYSTGPITLTIRSNFRRFERISSCMPKFERLIQALRADFQKNVLKPPEESKK